MPPANDDWVNAQVITGASGSATGDNTAGTLEAGEQIYTSGEPNGLGIGGGRSVWYKWTCPLSGAATFETSADGGTPIVDSTITIGQGTSVASFGVTAANDDGGVGDYSKVTFAATLGSVYYIAVDGYNGDATNAPGYNISNTSEGGFTLSWYVSVQTSSQSTLWRFLVTDLGGSSITLLDSLASERMVTPKLNEPLEVSGTVPSDSDYVNRLHTDNLPLVAEGARQLYCFRRESTTSPYYTIRASTLIMQINDASQTGDARSRFTAWDPWMFLFSRPVLTSNDGLRMSGPGDLLPTDGITYPESMTADKIAFDIIDNTVTNYTYGYGSVPPNTIIPAPTAARSCFIDRYSGTRETCGTFVGGYTIAQGTSVGQALKDLCDTGYMDIIFSPIYDTARPGILCELNIYSQSVGDGVQGAGAYRYSAVFAWDRPGRSMVAVENLYDGTGRANHIQYFNGMGGEPVTFVDDYPSIALYGQYFIQEFFPAETQPRAVKAIAAMQLDLRKNYRETLTVHPAPERSPTPFVDYYLGDRVPVYVGLGQRGTAAGDSRMRQSLPPGWTGAVPPSPDPFTIVWQRIYGIPVDIDDNGVETVRELLVGPVGAPPPVPGGFAPSGGAPLGGQVAVTTARRINRGGRIGR